MDSSGVRHLNPGLDGVAGNDMVRRGVDVELWEIAQAVQHLCDGLQAALAVSLHNHLHSNRKHSSQHMHAPTQHLVHLHHDSLHAVLAAGLHCKPA